MGPLAGLHAEPDSKAHQAVHMQQLPTLFLMQGRHCSSFAPPPLLTPLQPGQEIGVACGFNDAVCVHQVSGSSLKGE